MAIYPTANPPGPAVPAPEQASIARVEAWTVTQAADILSATSISSPSACRTPRPATLGIPIDACPSAPQPSNTPTVLRLKTPAAAAEEPVHVVHSRRTPIRRDSLARREALLKGKEGSRRRQRWENDRLLSNPYAQPPLPSDWEVRPTYRVQSVPYFLAPLWDAQYAHEAAERRKRAAAAKETPRSREEAAAQKVQRELKEKLKKSRGAKGLLQDLEVEVRGFVAQWEAKQLQLEREGLIETSDSEDEEIVFVGRNGAMGDERRKQKDEQDVAKDKLIFQSLVDDHGASFGRYLVHSIAQYYGLKTWSVTTGDPARREAYVGLKMDARTRRVSLGSSEMPRPLWAVV